MKFKTWALVLALAAITALFLVGCSDNNNDGGGNTPPPRIVGVWDANAASEDSLGIQQLTYYFYTDHTYRYYRIAPPTIDETGTWEFSGTLNDSIQFTATMRDSVAINPPEVYTWRYDIVEGATQAGDVLHMWMFLDPGYFEATLPRTQ